MTRQELRDTRHVDRLHREETDKASADGGSLSGYLLALVGGVCPAGGILLFEVPSAFGVSERDLE